MHWGGEIGRLPVTEGDPNAGGRDHNEAKVSACEAGRTAESKGGSPTGRPTNSGIVQSSTPSVRTTIRATLMHLFGIDHNLASFYHYNGQEQKLTDNRPCRVVKELLSKG